MTNNNMSCLHIDTDQPVIRSSLLNMIKLYLNASPCQNIMVDLQLVGWPVTAAAWREHETIAAKTRCAPMSSSQNYIEKLEIDA